MQIFEDVCTRFVNEDRSPRNSTPAELAKLIFQATTQIGKPGSFAEKFTIYKLRDRGEGGMTLHIIVENLFAPRVGYDYNLADQRGMLIDAV